MAEKRAPGTNPCAVAKLSLTITSLADADSGARPTRIWSRSSAGSPMSGSEMSCAVAGSRKFGMSSSASLAIRASTAATPGVSAIWATSDLGARRTTAKISANP
jgi:hypothetical protein